jgi:ankyrin repeat protein
MADVSEAGTGCGTLLQWTAGNGQIKAAELLLTYGANVNQKGTDEYTALGTAVVLAFAGLR